MSRSWSRDLYRELHGQHFPGYLPLHDAVLALFNRHIALFPPGYSYMSFLEWGKRNGWIRKSEGGYQVIVD